MSPNNNNEMELTLLNEQVVKQPHPVNQITPVSKYLAMTLFVMLPFVGGYVGYQLAPEKVVELPIVPTPSEQIDVVVENIQPESNTAETTYINIPNDWVKYENLDLGLSIKHPKNIIISPVNEFGNQTDQSLINLVPDAVMIFIDENTTLDKRYGIELKTFSNLKPFVHECVIGGIQGRCLDVMDHPDGPTHISVVEANNRVYSFIVIDKFIEGGNLFTSTVEFIKI